MVGAVLIFRILGEKSAEIKMSGLHEKRRAAVRTGAIKRS
jgi:hypothetical protein